MVSLGDDLYKVPVCFLELKNIHTKKRRKKKKINEKKKLSVEIFFIQHAEG